MTKISCILLVSFFMMSACNPVTAGENHQNSEVEKTENPTLKGNSEIYQQRYQLNSLSQKLVNNRGDGYENLYGVRNFRVVLRGVLYRGGANNAYNKYKVRDNSNPLQDDALKNLCEEGFKNAIYLYSTNFSTALKSAKCKTFDGQDNEINYQQITGLSLKNTDKILEIFYKIIKGQTAGPIYSHCWNGWHASGFVAAVALRQFCGMSAEKAVEYWIENTDGASAGHEDVIANIRAFKPRSQFQITETERQQICLSN
jgi:hypothetical protein